MKKTH